MDVELTNKQMVRICPEFASDFAKYPMIRNNWLPLKQTVPKSGDPAFVTTRDGATALKMHYVYGDGPSGKGYYHLLTKESHVILKERIRRTAVGSCCMMFDIEENKAWTVTNRVLSLRIKSSSPNDKTSAKQHELQKLAGCDGMGPGGSTGGLGLGAVGMIGM